MKFLCNWFGHTYRRQVRRSTHWASNTKHRENWRVCKRCGFEYRVNTERVTHADGFIRGSK